MQENGLYYFAFGRLEDRSVLYHFCFEEKYEKKFSQEAHTLLVKFQQAKVNPGDHQKIKNPNGSWYCTFDERRIAYMSLCSDDYSETQAYRMLSEIQAGVEEEIPSYWQKSEAEATAYANGFVPEIAEKFRALGMEDTLAQTKAQLDQVQSTAGESVKAVFNNVSNLEDLEENSQKLNVISQKMSDDSFDLAGRVGRRKWQIRLILLGTFITVVGLLYLIAVKKQH